MALKDCLEEELKVAGDTGAGAAGMLLVEELLAPILLAEEPAEGGLAPGLRWGRLPLGRRGRRGIFSFHTFISTPAAASTATVRSGSNPPSTLHGLYCAAAARGPSVPGVSLRRGL